MRSFRHFSSSVYNYRETFLTFHQHRLTTRLSMIAVLGYIFFTCLISKLSGVTDVEMFLIGTDLCWKSTPRKISLQPPRAAARTYYIINSASFSCWDWFCLHPSISSLLLWLCHALMRSLTPIFPQQSPFIFFF